MMYIKKWLAPFSLFMCGLLPTLSIAMPSLPIEHWQTSQGTPVYFFKSPNVPMLDIAVAFDAGSARDGGQYGLANLTNQLLSEGTLQRSDFQVAADFENIGAQFNVSTDKDMGILSLRTLTEPTILDKAISVFTDVLSHPSFLPASIARNKEQILRAIEQRQQQPDVLAARAFENAIYPAHPYGHAIIGETNTIKDLTAENVRAFYRRYYVRKNAVIVMVGAITKAQAIAIAEKLVAQLPLGTKPAPLPAPVMPTQLKNIKIDYPSQQTHIMIGQPGISANDADLFPLLVGNYVLGGNTLITSRLSNEVREKRGLAYSVNSRLSTLTQKGPFVVALQTSDVSKALPLTLQTIEQLVAEGPTEKEVKIAKQNITGSFILGLASNADIAAQLLKLAFYQRPIDFLDTFNDRINAVTTEQIRNALKQRIHPETMVTVTVGQVNQNVPQTQSKL